ncbi:unnamed protein product [Tenebrio molitor]|nr:unnamed protein product [Tenebrio molitor]
MLVSFDFWNYSFLQNLECWNQVLSVLFVTIFTLGLVTAKRKVNMCGKA